MHRRLPPSPFFLPSHLLASLPPLLASPLPTLPVPPPSAATFSARFASFPSVCMRLDLHGDSEITISLYRGMNSIDFEQSRFLASMGYYWSMIGNFERFRRKKERIRDDRNKLENWYECFWIILYSWAHALSRARGYIRPDYAEGGPINVRRRPLFVRTRSLRSVANFSRGASPLLRDSSICPIFRWLGRRGPIRVDARGRLRWTAAIRGRITSHWSSARDGIRAGLSWNH